MEQLHIARVRRIAVEHLRCPRHPPHDFSEGRVLEIGQAGTGLVIAQMRKEQVPETLFTRLIFQGLHEGNRILTRMHFLVPLADARNDVGVHERTHLGA
jgi:DNA-binding IclR family transcriptional regulator